MTYENRRHPRLDIPLGCRFRLEGVDGWLDGQLVNLSATGAALRTEMDVPQGAKLSRLCFRLPPDGGQARAEVDTEAVVVHRESGSGPLGNAEHRLGLRFVDIDSALLERVRLFVFRQLQRSD